MPRRCEALPGSARMRRNIFFQKTSEEEPDEPSDEDDEVPCALWQRCKGRCAVSAVTVVSEAWDAFGRAVGRVVGGAERHGPEPLTSQMPNGKRRVVGWPVSGKCW